MLSMLLMTPIKPKSRLVTTKKLSGTSMFRRRKIDQGGKEGPYFLGDYQSLRSIVLFIAAYSHALVCSFRLHNLFDNAGSEKVLCIVG
jgi:hypothetical protein